MSRQIRNFVCNIILICSVFTLYYHTVNYLPITESNLKCDWVKGSQLFYKMQGEYVFSWWPQSRKCGLVHWKSVHLVAYLLKEGGGVCSDGHEKKWEQSLAIEDIHSRSRCRADPRTKTASCGLECGTSTVSTDTSPGL